MSWTDQDATLLLSDASVSSGSLEAVPLFVPLDEPGPRDDPRPLARLWSEARASHSTTEAWRTVMARAEDCEAHVVSGSIIGEWGQPRGADEEPLPSVVGLTRERPVLFAEEHVFTVSELPKRKPRAVIALDLLDDEDD